MILDDLKEYIIAHPYCAQADLASAFVLTEDGIEAMLSVWGKKGKLKVTWTTRRNKPQRLYRWLDNNEIGLMVL